ncbi:hypothetical protein KPL71_020670 [Citrus sinensis]|uniref:Uncharacterized protein n=1 Tax=Citrus sinensis TaxID=2711 RepID=A0ACB8J9L9_CITSI|nr:hypothetical protein KPL71_020670 [Citrus sinensis]
MLLVLAPFGSALFEKLESTDNNLLLPFFVIAYGMRVSTINIFGKKNALTSSNARCFVSVVKFVVCLLPPLCSKMPTKDALALASIMRCKGVLELGIFSFLSDKRVMNRELYSYMFLLSILSASIVPMLVIKLYDPLKTLMTGKPELWAKGWHKTLGFVSPWYILQNAKDDGFED